MIAYSGTTTFFVLRVLRVFVPEPMLLLLRNLPIDFQIQRQTQANADNPKGSRQPLGIFLDYPGKRPTDMEKP